MTEDAGSYSPRLMHGLNPQELQQLEELLEAFLEASGERPATVQDLQAQIRAELEATS